MSEVIQLFEAILVSVLGLVIGSFLNVCIYRLPLGQSVAFPGSHCMSCGARLTVLDLVPVVSYLCLGGRCRHCKVSFSARYMMVEVLTASLYYLCWTVFGLSSALLPSLILLSFLVMISFIDYDHQLIYDKVLVWLALIGVAANSWTGTVTGLDMVIAACIGGGVMLLIAVVSNGGMGGGDIKLMAVLGVWLGWKLLLLTLLESFLLGGVLGVLLIALKIKGRKDYIPFGPFIAIAAGVSLLYGDILLQLYIR